MNNIRDYYSVRTGKVDPNPKIDLEILKRLFLVIYNGLEEEGYFQKYLGYYCVDQDYIDGKLGSDLELVFLINLKKENLYPIRHKITNYTEDDLFDVLEFLYDFCSKGIDGFYHDWNNCGQHYTEFDDALGKVHFRDKFNPILKSYGEGYEITNNGEILKLVDTGFSSLIDAELPTDDVENITLRVERAISKFRRYRSSLEDRQDAIRDLVDVLEYLRPEAKKYLQKEDESDLFNIANNFGIRHHNEKQKSKYDKSIWHSWMFYHYLSTIHALQRIINMNKV
ncbi:hypothetical protein [Pontibacter amylolyticus]|uniref:Uncharacterized protein n=1 Tax=Pontibacter amylolyticus TaxID=1424080 RepID=A0ABQ1W8E4_9BACT|nr:hypothetical protein [Pontibacter amylolyticus]GGG17204.1 hypothetical protein GCM10011323_21780 [Pontibacter amylolyticus]